jgi:DMSO/TMAO reductase YedYZ molybdopterin-dependent catalytic subunit
VGFFERNRAALEQRGFDPARLPPGQYFTERFPVLHVGDVPTITREQWTLRLFGEVAAERTIDFAELAALPNVDVEVDIHCVTKWSKFDTRWRGVRFRAVMALVEVAPSVTHVVEHAEYGYTTNVPLPLLLDDDVLLTWEYDGEPLEAEHGGPVRLLLPRLYFWKSAKWLRGLEFVTGDRPGFWERNGYHNEGDPWREQRYWGD